MIQITRKETTSTTSKNGEEVNKYTGLSETKKDTNEPKNEQPLDELLGTAIALYLPKEKATKIAQNLLEKFDHNLIDLFTATISELTQVKGIGFARACTIKAVFGIMQRLESSNELHPKIESKEDVIKLLAPYMKYKKQEEFRVLLLDNKKRLINQLKVAIGTIDKAYVHPRDVFRPAVAAGAKSIIIVHNHPSGDPEPSKADFVLTRELCMCSKIVDIEISDHIIIGLSDHVSMKEKGGVIINEIK
ncbi:MAG: DNA repair protein RadC [Candidatus Methanofastidiosia archaeon]